MKKIIKYALLMSALLIILNCNLARAQSKSDAIIGEWQPKKKNSHIIIYKNGGKYFGKLKLLQPGDFKDVNNPDKNISGRQLMGLPMLNNFIFDGNNDWEDGTIYDPDEGKTYSCKLSLKSPNELKVRGYVGISMFGRTEIWTRVNN